jgi:magnesium transporter
MSTFTTFYLSRIIGKKVHDAKGKYIGTVKDLLIDSNNTSGKPLVIGIMLKHGRNTLVYSFDTFVVEKIDKKIEVTCESLSELPMEVFDFSFHLADAILDKQIVDLNGRKLVRVNDVRLVSFTQGCYVVAVDIGIEGLLRRIGIVKPIKFIINLFGVSLPSKFILWEDVEAVDFSNFNIKLSKSYTKLETLHPSDLADIIEELGKKERTDIFSALDEEKAADVLEELEPETQVHLVESLPVEKVADVFEKMPADEVADILDEIEADKAEILLNEMDKDSSQEVRELLEYPNNTVGSIMTTEILTFREDHSIGQVINELRARKPENDELYNLFVADENDKLIATFSLRDLVLSQPETKISEIMKPAPVHLHDYEKVDEIAEMVSKYNMLAIPVIDDEDILQGMVVIDDVVEDLINKRRTNK